MSSVLTTQPWLIHQKRTGTSYMVSHTQHYIKPILDRNDSPTACVQILFLHGGYWGCVQHLIPFIYSLNKILSHKTVYYIRADSRFAPSQWETSLQSNAISHWLGTNLESALYMLSHFIQHRNGNDKTQIKFWNNNRHPISDLHCYGPSIASILNKEACVIMDLHHYDLMTWKHSIYLSFMVASSNGHIFLITGLCARNLPVTSEFSSQRPVTWSFDVFFDLRLNKWLCIQSLWWWFEMPLRSLWCHCNVTCTLWEYSTRHSGAPFQVMQIIDVCSFCSPEQVAKQIIQLPVVWNVMAPMW